MRLRHFLLFSFLLAGTFQARAQPTTSVLDLKADYRVNPLGLDRFPPALSWRMDAKGRAKAAQTAYQLVSAATKADLLAGKTTWDSGKIASNLSTQIPYSGPKPQAGERVWWRVKPWDENGNEGSWSEPAWFEAGLLDEAGWKGASWIGSNQEYLKPEAVPAELMGPWIAAEDDAAKVSGFALEVDLPDKPIVSAMMYGGTGTKKNRGYIVVNYAQMTPYNQKEMDRAGRRSDGFVEMSFYLFPGKQNRIELRLDKPQAKATAAVGMRIAFADGTEMTLASDTKWQALTGGKPSGPVKVAEPYGGPQNGVVRLSTQTNVPPTWFRQGLTVKPNLVSARLYSCALGQGLAYLNGKLVDDVFFSSPQSEYEELGYYTTHDITPLLREGENALAIQLDGGWYHEVGGFGTSFSYGRPGLKALVRLTYADGSTSDLVSDATWQWKEGAIRMANIFRGERVDYRIDHEEWKKVGDGSGWQNAQILPPLTPKTLAIDVNPVRPDGQLTPVKTWKTGEQTWLFDMGTMTHGVAQLKFQEAAGKTIRFRYSEYCEKGKMMNVPQSQWHVHGLPQMDEVIADGKPRTYQSRHATKSFRFIEVSGLSKEPQVGDLIAIPVHTQAEIFSSFDSSDPMLNRLYQNGIRTFQNYINHVTGDIPRERCLWGAESLYSKVPATYCFDWAPNHRLMNDLWWTGTMTPDDIPGQIGLGKRLTNMTQSFLWSATPVFLTSEISDFYGDHQPAATHYEKARHFLRFFEKTAVDGGIPTPNLLADHAGPMLGRTTPITPEEREAKQKLDAQEKLVVNALAFFDAQNRFAAMAERLGKTEDATHARAYASTIRNALLKFYDSTNHTFGNGTQDSLALAYGLMSDPTEVQKLATSLVEYYRKNGHVFDGGFMSYEVYPMLSRYGNVEDAYTMLVNDKAPGPAWSVKKYDATSLYELYAIDREEQMKVGQNFFAFGHYLGWLITDLAGIRYTKEFPNGKRMNLAPKIPRSGKLSHVTASLKTPMGTINSAWTYQNDTLAWKFTVPANTTAEVQMPTGDVAKIQGTDTLKLLRQDADSTTYEAQAGDYQITSPLSRR